MSAFIWGTICWAGMNIKASRDRYLSAGTFGPPSRLLNWPKSPHRLGLSELSRLIETWESLYSKFNCFFLDSKKLSLTFTQRCNQSFSIFIMLELVFLNGFAVVGSKGGYFVNLLQFPSLCPLTSFCAAWNPTGPHKNITLIDHGKIQLAVDGIHILRCCIWILHGNL